MPGVGNWKALFPAIRAELPQIQFDRGARAPVVIGEDYLIYLREHGPEGRALFKQSVRELLNKHDRIFVFETQKIDCLQETPSCIRRLLKPGRVAVLFFRGEVDARIEAYLKRHDNTLRWERLCVQPNNLGEAAPRIAAEIIIEEFQKTSRLLTGLDHETFVSMQERFVDRLVPEIEDQFLEDGTGVLRLRDIARRKMACMLLRETLPPYSVRSRVNAVDFFREEILEKFVLLDLPAVDISDASPNLAFVIKSNKQFNCLSTLVKAARAKPPGQPYLG